MISQKKMNRLYLFAITIVFIVAFVLRIIGADWGMPYGNLHPDEGIIYNPAYQNALERNFEVQEYYRPNHVTIKLNTLLYIGIQELYFAPNGQTDFALNYSENFALFMTASRVLTALFGFGTVVLAFCIGRFWGKKQALLVALLFAIFPSFLEHSHYITPDIPLLFFLLGVLWASFCYHKKPTTSWLFWTCFFTALATCEKYPGIYGCMIIAVTVCVTHIKTPALIIKKGFLAILFVVLGIMAVSPVLLVDLRTVLEVMAGQNKQYHPGADGLNFVETLWFYIKTTGEHLGLILSVVSIFGVVRMLKKNMKQAIILLSFFAYILPISTLSVYWERYTLPIYAVGLVFGTVGFFYLIEDLRCLFRSEGPENDVKNRKTRLHLCVCALILLLPLGSLFLQALAVTGSFLAPDSRILLQDKLSSLNVTATNTVYDCNTPLDPGGYYGAFCNFEDGDPAKFKYGSGPTYVMTSSAQRDVYLNEDPEVYGWIKRFYEKLDEDYLLVYMFPVEIPSSHFLEIENMWYAARSIYRYLKGAAVGYEIRLYQMV